VAELHEADLGDLIEALDPEERPRLVELTGADFDFSALNEVDDTVREEILEELEPRRSRKASANWNPTMPSNCSKASTSRTRRRFSKSCRNRSAIALERSLDYPENSAGRRMQTEFIAVPAEWTVGQRSTTCATRPTCRTVL